jgi:hypothetical protein
MSDFLKVLVKVMPPVLILQVITAFIGQVARQ